MIDRKGLQASHAVTVNDHPVGIQDARSDVSGFRERRYQPQLPYVTSFISCLRLCYNVVVFFPIHSGLRTVRIASFLPVRIHR